MALTNHGKECLLLFIINRTGPSRGICNNVIAHCEQGRLKEALHALPLMDTRKFQPDSHTYASLLQGCRNTNFLPQAKLVHAHIILTGFKLDRFLGTKILIAYAKCGGLVDARWVLEELRQPNAVSWTTMIAAYSKHELDHEALGLFYRMQRSGIRPDEFTFASVLPACASMAALEHGKQIQNDIIRSGFLPDVFVGSALIDMYIKCGCFRDARKVFDEMPERNVVSWNTMVTGYAENGDHEEALRLFCEMQQVGVGPDEFTFASVLPSCTNLVALEHGRQVHEDIIRKGLQSDVYVRSALVDMYAKSGSIEDAREVFAKMPERNIISWNAIISGCAQHGNGKEAIQLFEKMKATGMQPDHITFVGVLSACSHVGLLEEGSKYFDSISRDYDIMPRMEHYSCIVDLLSRAGHLDQAEAFIHTMPLKPSGLVLRTLLSACRVHDNMEIGRRAAECLLELEPLDATSYLLLSSIFAASGRWNDAAKMRKIMNERGVKKEPGCSWIEVNKRVHAFITEDRSQELAEDTYANLQKVSIVMKDAGHILGTSFMLHDEQDRNEHNHFQESKKLAINS